MDVTRKGQGASRDQIKESVRICDRVISIYDIMKSKVVDIHQTNPTTPETDSGTF